MKAELNTVNCADFYVQYVVLPLFYLIIDSSVYLPAFWLVDPRCVTTQTKAVDHWPKSKFAFYPICFNPMHYSVCNEYLDYYRESYGFRNYDPAVHQIHGCCQRPPLPRETNNVTVTDHSDDKLRQTNKPQLVFVLFVQLVLSMMIKFFKVSVSLVCTAQNLRKCTSHTISLTTNAVKTQQPRYVTPSCAACTYAVPHLSSLCHMEDDSRLSNIDLFLWCIQPCNCCRRRCRRRKETMSCPWWAMNTDKFSLLSSAYVLI